MRKYFALLGAASFAAVIPTTPVMADGATVGKDACFSQVPDANGVLTGDFINGTASVRTNRNWSTATCHFNLLPSQTPAKRTRASGFACTVAGDQVTFDSDVAASPGGQMSMTCRFKKTP